MRFCFVTTFYPPYHFGGDAVYVQALAHALDDAGHTVDVIHNRDAYRALAGRQPQPAAISHPNVTVHGLESRWGLLDLLAMHQTGRAWRHHAALRDLLNQPFDVIHYHNVSLMGGADVLGMGRAVKLYTPHEFWLVCPTHVLLRDGQTPCPAPACFTCSLRQQRPPQLWRHTGSIAAAVRQVDRFLMVSHFADAMHRQRGLRLPVSYLPHFVPPMPAASDRAPVAMPPGVGEYFLFVGRLERLKGLHTVIPTFRRNADLQLVVVGSGQAEADLRAQAAGAANIHFLGARPRQELPALYAGATALIVPSICYEIFGLVVIEALAHATPVIARRQGSLVELVGDHACGLLFDEDASLEAALRRLAHDPDLRQRLGQQGQAAYQREWTVDVHLARYLAIIAEVLAERATHAT
jgi:glycosyltransferase involved in cell wall biosynthesis